LTSTASSTITRIIPSFHHLKKIKKTKKNKKLKNMTKNQNQRKPNIPILREKNEEIEGEEGGYFKFYERQK